MAHRTLGIRPMGINRDFRFRFWPSAA